MENIEIAKVQEQFHVNGFPNAVKIFKLEGPKSKRLSDLALHIADLDFALQCLGNINGVPDSQLIIRQALWRSAVVHYIKCFGNSEARFRLVAESVYKKNPEAMEPHKYFASLRNKHFVHDENSWSQCEPGAILNRKEMDHKIAKVVCIGVTANTLDQAGYNNLHLLATLAKNWTVTQFDQLCIDLTNELEVEKYETLLAREEIIYTPPTVDKIHEPRNIAKGSAQK